MRVVSSLQARVAAIVLGASAAPASAAVLPQFPPGAVWNQDITNASPHDNSGTMISTLAGICGGDYSGCGFGFGRLQIDFSIHVLHAAAGAPTQPVIEHAVYENYYDPDCEPVNTPMPLPPGGAIEGSPGNNYTCDNGDNDCHLLVVQGTTLYEAYSANVTGAGVDALCLATWDLSRVYPAEGRGDHCTSADAAGFPIAPLLFNADEIRAALARPVITDRHLGHAIRFILPNDKMASLPDGPDNGSAREPVYVRPASHAGGPDGPTGTVPYGSRLRLRADFPFTNYTPAAQVILRTLQKYGMVLADGGGVALTAESDRFTTAKWTDADVALHPSGSNSRAFDLTPGTMPVTVNDFTVLATGDPILETYNCVRTVFPTGQIFADGFE